MRFVYHDGGRKRAGFKGKTGDCVVRAIAIGTGTPYQEVYDTINDLGRERLGQTSISRTGVPEPISSIYLRRLGWVYTGMYPPCELSDVQWPDDRVFIVWISRHYTTIKNGAIYDTWKYQSGKGRKRWVWGFWSKKRYIPIVHLKEINE